MADEGNQQARHDTARLQRQVGLGGAVLLGLGSIVGTGVFVGIGLAAGVAGAAVAPAIALAAVVATCNALSSAQLAANHPHSGGTYEYGYQYLNPWFGFTAGWMFLCAKSASAATAAMGVGGYLTNLLPVDPRLAMPLGVGTVAAVTLLAAGGARRSNLMNLLAVTLALGALVTFCAWGAPAAVAGASQNLWPMEFNSRGFWHATALMFVAYTGYGRLATLGEEVVSPRTTIPRAIVVTLVVSAGLYLAVALVALAAVGPRTLSELTQQRAAPLEALARQFGGWPLAGVVAVGALAAMVGVLLNLILGLSRIVLAMGRRGDLPAVFARLNARRTTPYVAVLATGLVIATLATLGTIQVAWSFSAFSVLVYYAITNLAALCLPRAARLYHPAWAWSGLAACLFLAFWVEPRFWIVGLALIAGGLLWKGLFRFGTSPPSPP